MKSTTYTALALAVSYSAPFVAAPAVAQTAPDQIEEVIVTAQRTGAQSQQKEPTW
jgi:hypothetical protein